MRTSELGREYATAKVEETGAERDAVCERVVFECVEQGALELASFITTRQRLQGSLDAGEVGEVPLERKDRTDGCGRPEAAAAAGRTPLGERRRRRGEGADVDLQHVSQSLAERPGELGLAGHHTPELLPRRPGDPGELLFGQPASDSEHLELFSQGGQFGKTCLDLVGGVLVI